MNFASGTVVPTYKIIMKETYITYVLFYMHKRELPIYVTTSCILNVYLLTAASLISDFGLHTQQCNRRKLWGDAY